MASKRNWIAFILYFSFYLPVSFSTTLEPSSESPYFTSLSTGSTNNASDITNTSILSELTSSPSPEAPTTVPETSHISEELSTQFPIRTTVLLDHEDLSHGEHPATSLPVNATSSLDDNTNSTMTPAENSTRDLVSNKLHPPPEHTTSQKNLSFAKSSSVKKQMISKNPKHFIADKTVTTSVSNLADMNETNQSLESTSRNESDISNQTQMFNSGLLMVSEISQGLDDTPDFRTENNAAHRNEKLNPPLQNMLFHSVTSQKHANKTGVNSGVRKMSITKPHLQSENDVQESRGVKNESSEPNILQKDSNSSHSENSTHFSTGDDPVLNSSSIYENTSLSPEEPSSVRPHTNVSQSRKKRSGAVSPSFVTEIPKTYLTASTSDASSDDTHSSDTPNIETVKHQPEKAVGSVSHAADYVTLSGNRNTLPQSKLTNTSYTTTLHSTDLPLVGEKSHEINSSSRILSTLPSEVSGLTYIVKEVSESGSSPSTTERVSVVRKSDEIISNISGSDLMTASTKAPTEKPPVAEDAVASSVPLCKDDDEIDVESTSEISIKVFPLCEKREVPKVVTSVSSSERSIFGTKTSSSTTNPSTEKQNDATKRSGSILEGSNDSRKILESNQEGYQAEGNSENITLSYKSSLAMTEHATDSSRDDNHKPENLIESVSAKTPVNNVLNEDVEVRQNEMQTKGTEASDPLNTEAHSNFNDLMEIEFTEDERKQGKPSEDQITTTPSNITRDVEAEGNDSSNVLTIEEVSANKSDRNFVAIKPTHQSLKEIVSNSSSSLFDYVADQSEILPVMSDPPSQNISFIQDFTTRKEIKIMEDAISTDTSVIYKETNITESSDKYETRQNNESLAEDVITATEKSISTEIQDLPPISLSETVVNLTAASSEGSGDQETNAKSDNVNSTETKIAGVGVKTTVSVSLNVTKMNSTKMDNAGKDSISHLMSPVVTFINLTSSSHQLPSDVIKIDTKSNQNATDSSKSPEGIPLGSPNADPTKLPEGTPSPPPPSSTTRSFGIRKPRLRINGGSSESVVTRKPFLVKTPPTRASEVGGPVSIFQKGRTRLGSITSSTTQSTTARASWKPFMGQPMTWRYGFENFTFVPETETVPTTTEEEVQDADTETVSFSTLSDFDTFMYKVPASIVVRKGINCLSDHFKNKHSPEYKSRARLVRKMLRSLFHGSEIAPRVLDIQIDSMYCRTHKNITVDYNLYLSKSGSEIQKEELVKIFNSILENSTFNQWVLDPSATAFYDPLKEVVNTPAPSTEDVEPPIPQWAIAVIVIGAASLVFIVLFGALTVYGRHHMRRRYNGSRLGDDDVDRAIDSREWDDKMAATYENLAADGIYDIDDGGFDTMKRGPYGHARHSKMNRHDSWKSDWTERPRRSRYPNDF